MQATQPIRTFAPPKALVALVAAAILASVVALSAALAPSLGLGTNAGAGNQPQVTEFHRSWAEIYGTSSGGVTEFHRSFADIYKPAPLTLDQDAGGAGQRGAGAKVAQ